jgi:carbon monoxide dehydrogenase subunit G
MEITGEYRIPAPRQAVWEGLNDPEILRQCIPGCESLDKVSDTEFAGSIVAKVGPVKAKFQGGVKLSDLDPPNGYTLSGEGKGAAAGFANGKAKVKLRDEGAETVLSYDVDAQVGGKLAQVGARLIDGTVKKLSGEFFAKFGELVAARAATSAAPVTAPVTPPAAAAQPSPQPTPAEAKSGGIHPAIWVTGVIAAVGALLWAFSGR